MLCFSLALFGGGYLKSAFFPRVNSDFVVGNVEMPQVGHSVIRRQCVIA